METFISTETLIIELLLVASLVAIGVRGLRIPYTVALVIVGLLLTIQSPFKISLTSDLILALFVPPLVFEAAFHLNFNELRKNLLTILVFAIPGVVLTMLLVGGILYFDAQIHVTLAFLFGALISATDPVAVIATFRKMGAPPRLTVLLEGESLLNDGTAIVVFNIMLAVALTGQFNLVTGIYDFIRVAAGGTVIGLVLGWIISRVIARVDDYLIETTLTTVLAFGSYLVAEQLHFSGVLAVVAAGLINGNLGPQGMSPTTRIVITNFWEYMAFLVNSIIFLLIGSEVNLPGLLAAWQHILWAILAVLVARVMVTYSIGWIIRRTSDPIPHKWLHVISWSGLRGAISLALALSLPMTLGSGRETLLAMTFGVVLFTLLIQSTTMQPLIRWLGIITRSSLQIEYETRHARLAALRSADRRIDRLHIEGLLSTHTRDRLKKNTAKHAEKLVESVQSLLQSDPTLEAEELDKAWREMLRSQRSTLVGLRRDGAISDEVYEKLTAELDAQLIEGSPDLQEVDPVRTQFLEVTLPVGSLWEGMKLSEVDLPRSAVLVSIRRKEMTLIPRGDTTLTAGDVVTTLCERDVVNTIREYLTALSEELK
jgi:CPA1 family monovalent cation:H+ antiporter